MQSKAVFIEYPAPFDPENKSPAPVFQKRFEAKKDGPAMLSVCPLGLGCIYLNGEPITQDLFIAPVSDYRKTLWYNVYEVGQLLKDGENVLTAILGNGFYNESLKTGWDFDTAEWRGNPKLWLRLQMRGGEIVSDESWRCSKTVSPILFNELRSGEKYDCRIGEGFRLADSADWKQAVRSEDPPRGALRECTCPPVREFEHYRPVKDFTNTLGRRVYDFGQNLSGYADITLKGAAGSEIVLRYGERLHQDGTLDHNGMDGAPFYQGPEYQTQRILLSGGADHIKPRFSYFGFRYLEIEGEAEILDISSVFVHQAVKEKAYLTCSDETVNRILHCAKMSVWSNLFYILTDCPTREKLGWTNDAIASLEQLYLTFDIDSFFKKWLQDILDSVTEEGEVPSIVPTWGWGLERTTSCIGPLCSGIICELPVAMYDATGELTPLRRAYPKMLDHLSWMAGKEDEDGFVDYGLGDWAGPFHYKDLPTPREFVTTAQYLRLMRLTLQSAKLLGEEAPDLQEKYDRLFARFNERYYDTEKDRCKVHSQSALSQLIDLRGASEGLREQLLETVREKDFHHWCGMVTMRHLYAALDRCNLNEAAYKIVTAHGSPSYNEWLEDGATTLYEMWNTGKSNNHHMNSCVVAWLYKALLGVRRSEKGKITLAPFFPEDMKWCKGNVLDTSVSWERTDSGVLYRVSLPCAAEITIPDHYDYNGSVTLQKGEYTLHFTKK